MRMLILAFSLAAVPALAQTANRSWTGDALRFTPSSVESCKVTLMEAATRDGMVVVTLRNAGTGTLSYTLSGELAGNGQRSIATATGRLPAGLNVGISMMRPYVGSLSGSVLTLRGSACTAGS